MGAHMLDAVFGQHADSGVGTLLGVFMGDGFLALRPAFDAFEQGAAEVPLGLAGGQGRVQMDMRFYKRRNQQLTAGVDIAGLRRHAACLQGDGTDQRTFTGDRVQTRGFTQCGIDDLHGRSCR